MNAYDLMDAMGEINGSFVSAAQEFRQGGPVRRRPSPLRVILVAALIAVLLTGCAAVYLLRLENMKVGEYSLPTSPQSSPETQPQVLNMLSNQGIQGSPNYSAAREWYEYQQNYKPNLEDRRILTEEEQQYISYAVYNREMADKVDEICEKYGLERHGEWFHHLTPEDMYRFLGIGGILKPQVKILEPNMGGTLFQDGSFRLEGNFSVQDSPWPHPISFFYQYTRKNVFDDVVSSMGDLDSFRQWDYQTEDGPVLLLALGPSSALICADTEEGFVHLDIANGDWGEPFQMDETQLEQVADLFDFTIRPQPMNEAAVEEAKKIQDAAVQAIVIQDPYAVESFEEFARNVIQNMSWCREPDVFYTIRDMNGDGAEELVIVKGEKPCMFVAMRDGRTDRFCNGRQRIWCENDVFIEEYDYSEGGNPGPGDKGLSALRYEGRNKVVLEWYLYSEEGWEEAYYGTAGETSGVFLSDQELQEILSKYKPIDMTTMDLRPLKDLAE